MKMKKIIYGVLSAAMLVLAGCEEKADSSKNGQVTFTVRYSDLSYNYAVINVKHDGPDSNTMNR